MIWKRAAVGGVFVAVNGVAHFPQAWRSSRSRSRLMVTRASGTAIPVRIIRMVMAAIISTRVNPRVFIVFAIGPFAACFRNGLGTENCMENQLLVLGSWLLVLGRDRDYLSKNNSAGGVVMHLRAENQEPRAALKSRSIEL